MTSPPQGRDNDLEGTLFNLGIDVVERRSITLYVGRRSAAIAKYLKPDSRNRNRVRSHIA